MNKLKKIFGILWMFTGPASFIFLTVSAFKNINSSVHGDISNPIPWIIVITIFFPIAIGLTIFGWYSWKGEYNKDVLK